MDERKTYRVEVEHDSGRKTNFKVRQLSTSKARKKAIAKCKERYSRHGVWNIVNIIEVAQ